MLSKTILALAAASLASAQTHSLCNPVKGDKCPDNPAFGSKTTVVDFTQGKSSVFTAAAGTTLTYDDSNGAVFSIKQAGNAPTITSTNYLFFGRVEVELQASVGVGVVTSLVLQSDDLDEIDWEWLGGDAKQVQTNYFSKGDTTTYDRGGFSNVANPQSGFHTYTIDWSPEAINWEIDGTVVRTLTYDAAKGGSTFPQTPMQVKLGTWVAGSKDAPKGTVEWAGGYTDFSKAPFIGYYRKVTITDYSNGVKGATSYTYSDESGTMKSIKVNTDGAGSSNGSKDESSGSSSSSSKPSSTASGSSAKTTLSTATAASSNGTAQATGSGGSDSSSGTQGSSTSSPTPTKSFTPASSGFRSAANLVAVGAAVFFSYIL